MKRIFILLTVLLGVGFTTTHVSADENIPSKPINSSVYDPKDYLSEETEQKINDLNKQYEKGEEKFQVGVYVTDTIGNKSIEEVGLETARKWKVGFSSTNNGALVVIAIKDRKFRIETSDNVATKVTDSVAKNILNEATTYFKDKDYNVGTIHIVENVGSYYEKGEMAQEEFELSNSTIVTFVVILIVLWALLITFGDGDGYFLGGGSSSRGSSGDSSWSGGGFGGGGASGGW